MLKAIIFDFDGIIADTEPAHLKGFKTTLKEINIELTDDDYYDKYLAYDDKRLFAEIIKDNDRKYTDSLLEDLIARKHRIMTKLFKEYVELFPGFMEFLNLIGDRYIISIASGALRSEIEFILRKFEIDKRFNNITAAEDVVNCKPDPEPFNLCLYIINRTNGTNIKPTECLVFEDSVHGLEAAKAAKMKCIAITNSYSHNTLKEADLIVNGFNEVNIEIMERLFK